MSDHRSANIEVTITGDLSDHPADLVMAIEDFTEIICKHVDQDRVERGIMLLLTAAAHLAMINMEPQASVDRALSGALANAIRLAALMEPDEPSARPVH